MIPLRIRHLIHKFITDQLSSKEANQLKAWVQLDPENQREFKKLIQLETLLQRSPQMPSSEVLWKDFQEKFRTPSETPSVFRLWPILGRVAAVGILLCAGYWTFQTPTDKQQSTAQDYIVLKIPSGDELKIDPKDSRPIYDPMGVLIARQNNRRIIWQPAPLSAPIQELEIRVPYGATLWVDLPDSSRVHLNSGSILKFKNRFDKNFRKVYLDGEAFFDVQAHPSHPFWVDTPAFSVQVLGTQFNLNTYDPKRAEALLVEGVVEILKDQTSRPVILNQTGDFALLESDNITKTKVDPTPYLAWQKGLMVFAHEPFSRLCNRLERKFGIPIDNQNTRLNQAQFSGTFSDESIDQILQIIQASIPFQYRWEGEHLIILNASNTAIDLK